MNRIRHMGYFQLASGMFLAGSSVVAGKMLADFPIFLIQTISLIIASAVIIPIAIMREGKFSFNHFKRKDFLYMALQALFGVLLFRVFMLLALRQAPASSTGIMLSTAPAVLAVLSYFFLKETIDKKIVLGISICVVGIVFINVNIGNSDLSFDWGTLLGSLFIFLSVLSESLFTIFRKKQSYDDKPLTTTAIVMVFASILFIPIGIYQYISNPASITFGTREMLAICYYGVMCSSVAYAFWFSGLAKVSVNQAAAFTGVMPISSLLLAAVFLKEKITVGHIFGMMLILAGIYMITLKREEKDSVEEAA